ncbi:MAG: hypothetical protein RMX68_015135 [Aulosira sp. ZfuVER01]|nr:hypothetical protein [Aulosira sp. ZfuVER01]MDZ8001437.1 hypothetical protein [Aulosira sp. DedVER01a]
MKLLTPVISYWNYIVDSRHKPASISQVRENQKELYWCEVRSQVGSMSEYDLRSHFLF